MPRLLTALTRLLALGVLALSVSGLLAQTAMANSLVGGVLGLGPGPGGEAPLTVTSSVPLLTPGLVTALEVRISNPSTNAQAVAIGAVTVEVSDASPACRAHNLTVTAYTAPTGAERHVVAPGHSVVLPLPITLRDTAENQDACQGASFPLEYTAQSAAVG
jgi:hypothetical protein